MGNALDRAPMGPARCALTLACVRRRLEWIEARLSYIEGPGFWDLPGHVAEWHELVPQQARLRCAAELLEAALRWQFESLHTAMLETVTTPCAREHLVPSKQWYDDVIEELKEARGKARSSPRL